MVGLDTHVQRFYNGLTEKQQQWVNSYIKPNHIFPKLMIFAFLTGIFYSCFKQGLISFIIWCLAIQVIFMYIASSIPGDEDIIYRLSVFIFSVFGWLIGRAFHYRLGLFKPLINIIKFP